MGFIIQYINFLTIFYSFLNNYKIRGRAISIGRVVIVRVTRSVHIAKVVAVVIIDRAKPPIDRRTRKAGAHAGALAAFPRDSPDKN